MRILAVVFYLSCPCKPIAECKNRLPWPSQIPCLHISINCTCCKHIWVMSRPVDIRDSSAMAMKCVLDRSLGCILVHIQVPYQRLLIGSAGHPVISCREWRPLYICHQPRKAVSKMAWRVQREIEVDYVESIGTTKRSAKTSCTVQSTYDASATSLPEGEIVADPTVRST